MFETARGRPHGKLESSLKNTFVADSQWPVDRASLAALVDMGLTDGQIGDYFAVAPDDVRTLRQDYGFR